MPPAWPEQHGVLFTLHWPGWGLSTSAMLHDRPHPNPSPEGEGLGPRLLLACAFSSVGGFAFARLER